MLTNTKIYIFREVPYEFSPGTYMYRIPDVSIVTLSVIGKVFYFLN